MVVKEAIMKHTSYNSEYTLRLRLGLRHIPALQERRIFARRYMKFRTPTCE